MGLTLRRFLQLGLLGGAVCAMFCDSATACWTVSEAQCYDGCPAQWPWEHPTGSGRYWRREPNPPSTATTWGCQTDYYDSHLCPDDNHALWCAGVNNAGQNYPPNLDDYVTYGPINLSAASVAQATFYLFDRTEAGHDSVFWGAARTFDLAIPDSMFVAGSHSGLMANGTFEARAIDLAHLRNAVTGDSASLLESPAVYLFWRFKSDGNANTDLGAFIDNVSVMSEDSCHLELIAGNATLMMTNGTPWNWPLIPYDSALVSFTWVACSSSVPYPSYRVMGFEDTFVVLDTVIAPSLSGGSYTVGTRPWILLPDSHFVRFVVDTLNQVAECDESDNRSTVNYFPVIGDLPPSFIWITPGDSTGAVYGDSSIVLRWEAYRDPNLPATLSFGSNSDGASCQGIMLPGGADIPEHDGPDSLVWDISSFTEGQILYLYARWIDQYDDVCFHAPFPVIRRLLAAGDHTQSRVPDHCYLSQNYPNPFNPSTELRFGIARAGHVTLTVYDVLGREVAMLVNGERSPGIYTLQFDGSRLSSGLYLYKLTTPEGMQTRKMMLMK